MSPRHTRMPFIPTRLAATALAVVLLAGCYPVQPRTATPEREDRTTVSAEGVATREGGDLVMGLSADPDQLDPTTSSSLYTRYVMSSICEKLYDIDAEGELVPQLATALPELRDDGPDRADPAARGGGVRRRHAVRRRRGAHQSRAPPDQGGLRSRPRDGSGRGGRGRRRPDRGDALRAAVRPDHGLPGRPRRDDHVAACARGARATTSATPPSASGRSSSRSGCQTAIRVVKDPRYYAADEVSLDSITYRIMTDANIRAANLRSGDVQVADSISPTSIDSLLREPGIGLLQIGSLGYQGITFNVGNADGVGEPPGEIDSPLADDARVRQAFEHVARPGRAGGLGVQQLVRAGVLADLARHRLRHRGQQRVPGVRPRALARAARGGRRRDPREAEHEGLQHP